LCAVRVAMAPANVSRIVGEEAANGFSNCPPVHLTGVNVLRPRESAATEHKNEFEERNVAGDAEALEVFEKLNVLSTPATLTDDEVVVGFDRDRLSQLLDIGT
jgi:hypothetical protein